MSADEARQTQGRGCRAVVDGQATFETFLTRTRTGTEVAIDGILLRPEGDGPFPALVLSHGGYGILPPGCHDHALETLTRWGYVVLLVDSFSARHPSRNRHGKHTFEDQAQDIHAALAYLASRADVDGRRIGLVAWSFGGTASLAALTRDRGFRLERRGRFRAAAAFYPMCLGELDSLQAPLLILIGTADSETPAARCTAMKRTGRSRFALDLQLIEGADHAFDFPRARSYHPVAAGAAMRRLKSFLAQHLR